MSWNETGLHKDSTGTPQGLHTVLVPGFYQDQDFTRTPQGVPGLYKDFTGSPPGQVAKGKVLP